MSLLRSAASMIGVGAVMLLTGPASAMPVVLDFATLPAAPWTTYSCEGGDKVSVDAGVLTIGTPSCFEVGLADPLGVWHQSVDNAKGWAVETRLRVDPSSDDNPDGIVMLWINDHTNQLIIGFTRDTVELQYPDVVGVAQPTTDGFHVYRVVSKLDQVRIYVDGALRLDHTLTQTGAGTNSLYFGDGDGTGASLSYWGYFSYDVDCAGGDCDPASTSSSSSSSSASAAASSAASTGSGGGAGGATGAGGAPGAGGARGEGPEITGRATCVCGVGAGADGSPGWLGVAALLALGRRRAGSGRPARRPGPSPRAP